jgi:hypothetical protein
MTAMTDGDFADETRPAAGDLGILKLTLGLVLITSLVCSIYASIDARGLYQDGVEHLFSICRRDGFSLFDQRKTVQILRQAPVVILSKFTSMSPFQRGQVFTFVLLMLPPTLCALCWFIVPRDRKAWILFPLAYLLIGFAPTSMHAIGEASIATSYYWILLFLFLFCTCSVASRRLFFLLSIAAFQLHEGAFPLTAVLLLACTMRARVAVDLRERIFIAASTLLFAAVFVYQIYWIIYPQFPVDREDILRGLMQFEFLYAQDHVNLPLVTAGVAALALTAVVILHTTQPARVAGARAQRIAIGFALFAIAASAAALLIEEAFSPFAQQQSRYFPVFVSTALGIAAVLLLSFRLPDRLWMQPATIIVLISLCAAQTVADIVATQRWHAFVVDLRSRLANARGLIPWETTLYTGEKRADLNWRLMATGWTIPQTSIVFAPSSSSIESIIDLPAGMTLRLVDPEKPDKLPRLRGVDYTPYRSYFNDRNR